MVEHLDYGSLSDRACFEIFHAVFTSKCDGFDFGHRVVVASCTVLVLLGIGSGSQVNHVANKYLDRDFAPVTFVYPLFDLLETAALRDVEHEEASR